MPLNKETRPNQSDSFKKLYTQLQYTLTEPQKMSKSPIPTRALVGGDPLCMRSLWLSSQQLQHSILALMAGRNVASDQSVPHVKP